MFMFSCTYMVPASSEAYPRLIISGGLSFWNGSKPCEKAQLPLEMWVASYRVSRPAKLALAHHQLMLARRTAKKLNQNMFVATPTLLRKVAPKTHEVPTLVCLGPSRPRVSRVASDSEPKG